MWSWLFSPPLAPGSPAPDFALNDEAGRTVRLSELRGHNVVLVFYPGDDTPTCTKQLCEFRDAWSDAKARDTLVFGVNPRGSASHSRFRQKFSLPFPLLIDAGGQVSRLYNAGGGWIVRRTVYLIGKDGRVRFAVRGKPLPAAVLAAAEA